MLTRKQATDHRRAIRHDIDRDLRAKARAKVRTLREKLREAHAHRTERLKELAAECRAHRLAVRDRLRETRARVLQELKETARAERAAARCACTHRKNEARGAAAPAIDQARSVLLAERSYQADLKRIERGNRARRATHPALASRAARQSESDDEVRTNIPRDLVPLFDKVRRGIRATGRLSRTEAFLAYAEQNPGEVFEVIELATARKIRELEAKHAAAAREARPAPRLQGRGRLPPRAPRRAYTAAELADVPF